MVCCIGLDAMGRVLRKARKGGKGLGHNFRKSLDISALDKHV
jgi:hypothetical protein